MDLDVIFLGTSGAVPTAHRGPAATLVRHGGERILVDCGEGTQRQLLRSGFGLADVDLVLLTHFHADHVLGLPGMLKTFALRGRDAPLLVVGPVGLYSFMDYLKRLFGRLTFPVEAVEVQPGEPVAREHYRIEPIVTDHGAPSIGYALCEPVRPGQFDVEAATALGVPAGPLFGRLQHGEAVTLDSGQTINPDQVVGPARPGRRIVFTGDTRPSPDVLAASAAADVLVHEATFLEEEADRAAETGHSTAAQAAALARDAAVSLLALTHLSTRHTARQVREEAQAIFPETVVPRDFDVIEVPFRERGLPQLIRPRSSEEEPAEVPETEPVPGT
jgi:ribonuclease Z